MARQASSKPADSTANLGCERLIRSFGIRHSGFDILERVQHFIHHLAPQTALRGSAFLQSEASPQVVSEAKDNMAGVDSVCLLFASAVLANGSMSSNQSLIT